MCWIDARSDRLISYGVFYYVSLPGGQLMKDFLLI